MKLFKSLHRKIYWRAAKFGLIPAKVVVMMDGGVSSQMYQYVLGELYRRRGYNIVFDLGFFSRWGLDINNEFVRNFDILKAFPDLVIDPASDFVTDTYIRKFYNDGNSLTDATNYSYLGKRPPVYLGGYYHIPSDLFLPIFKSVFRLQPEILDEPNAKIFETIGRKSNSVAVHVRRGDLKSELICYGKPASSDYFQNAVNYLKEKSSEPYFYFFSDEPNWVKDELVGYLKLADNEFDVIDINGSDKGYMDLCLIANCKHQITSKGSLGKMGALLGNNPDKIVTLCGNDTSEKYWAEVIPSHVMI